VATSPNAFDESKKSDASPTLLKEDPDRGITDFFVKKDEGWPFSR
jgi:hypothetical protein